MLGIISSLVGPAVDLATGYVKGKAEEKKAIQNAKIKKIENDANWEETMASATKSSWKDEYLTILFSIPILLCFLPFTVEYVERGFAALAMTPDWYKYTLGVIVSASFGIRGATKFFGKK